MQKNLKSDIIQIFYFKGVVLKMSTNTKVIDSEVGNGTEVIRTSSMTDEVLIAMLKKCEKKGWEVLSADWNKQEGCYVIKIKK